MLFVVELKAALVFVARLREVEEDEDNEMVEVTRAKKADNIGHKCCQVALNVVVVDIDRCDDFDDDQLDDVHGP